jgi:hypothetical protein
MCLLVIVFGIVVFAVVIEFTCAFLLLCFFLLNNMCHPVSSLLMGLCGSTSVSCVLVTLVLLLCLVRLMRCCLTCCPSWHLLSRCSSFKLIFLWLFVVPNAFFLLQVTASCHSCFFAEHGDKTRVDMLMLHLLGMENKLLASFGLGGVPSGCALRLPVIPVYGVIACIRVIVF